jgi:hypothetical protein
MLVLRADAFSYGDVPSFMRHKPVRIRNDAAIIASTTASLSLRKPTIMNHYSGVFIVRSDNKATPTYLFWLMSRDAQKHHHVM